MEGVDQKTLYVGLSRSQALAIQEGKPAFPEESASRFGLRDSPMAALERTNRFWAWHVSHHDPEEHPVPQPIDPKDFKIAVLSIPSQSSRSCLAECCFVFYLFEFILGRF